MHIGSYTNYVDCLLRMDLSMPRMGGIDAMKALIKRYDEQSAAQSASEEKGETVRCSEVRRPIVIALTASGTREDFEKCREGMMKIFVRG